jgi:hypothetical protein
MVDSVLLHILIKKDMHIPSDNYDVDAKKQNSVIN